MDTRVILIVAAISAVIWIGGETVKGVRWVKHHVKDAITKVVHPHRPDIRP